MGDRRREPTARKLVRRIEQASNPSAQLEWTRNSLDHHLESAERSRQHSEELLAELTEKLGRIASVRRATERSQNQAHRLRWEQRKEQQLAERNARRRDWYRERAELHPSGRGRPVRIDVDPTAWRALRAEAARRRISAKQLLGNIARGLGADFDPGAVPTSSEPRWRRTGAGRRAGHSTLVECDDDSWARLRARAVTECITLARLLGQAVEDHARQHRWSTIWPERQATSVWD